MKTTSLRLIAFIFTSSFIFTGIAGAADDGVAVNEKCPITAKEVNPKCNIDYEEQTYAFCSGKCRTKFKENVTGSLYDQIGGKAAVDAAVNLFYTKVLVDKRVNYFFEDVNMKRQHNRQKTFISAALGSPVAYEGKDMRTAHANMDVTEEHFNIIAAHLQETLAELKVKPELIAKVMTVVASTKDAVLGTKKG